MAKSTVRVEILEKIAAEAFPDVEERCVECRGTGVAYRNVHGVETDCLNCIGLGFVVREMTAREEHYWIIHLIAQRDRH